MRQLFKDTVFTLDYKIKRNAGWNLMRGYSLVILLVSTYARFKLALRILSDISELFYVDFSICYDNYCG